MIMMMVWETNKENASAHSHTLMSSQLVQLPKAQAPQQQLGDDEQREERQLALKLDTQTRTADFSCRFSAFGPYRGAGGWGGGLAHISYYILEGAI